VFHGGRAGLGIQAPSGRFSWRGGIWRPATCPSIDPKYGASPNQEPSVCCGCASRMREKFARHVSTSPKKEKKGTSR
jgi:hypothetical protein